jgi:hypothetical protein
MESAHPNPSCPSPPTPVESPTLLDTKVAAATDVAAVAAAATHIRFEYIGFRMRQRTQVPSQITPRTASLIGNLASGLKRKRFAPPHKAKKGATKKGGKYVVSKK